jgi:hypothetical protein
MLMQSIIHNKPKPEDQQDDYYDDEDWYACIEDCNL